MSVILYMLLGAGGLALVGLAAFIWALRAGQFDDPAGDAARILQDDDRPKSA
jgi:cbb3-type cytochrome oxidase maturation protein